MKHYFCFFIFLFLYACSAPQPQLLDEIDFGNISDESAHRMGSDCSEDYKNGNGTTARCFVQNRQIRWKAGECTFCMKVDSVRQNYFTLLFNGDETCENYMMLFINGKQIGYRSNGDIEPIYGGRKKKSGKYYAVTLPLPIEYTVKKDSVRIGIRCFGPLLDEAADSFHLYQGAVKTKSVGIYKGYTHVERHLPVTVPVVAETGKKSAQPDAELLMALSPDSLYLFGDWENVSGKQKEGVFVDTLNATVTIKQRNELFFVLLRWRSRFAVNRLAKVYLITPDCDYTATVYEEAKPYFCGLSYHRPGWVNSGTDGDREWYRGVLSANSGEKMLVSKVPSGERFRPGIMNPMTGRAKYYQLTYGDYWIAMNRTESETFTLPLPAEYRNGRCMSANEKGCLTGDSILLKPKTTIVFVNRP